MEHQNVWNEEQQAFLDRFYNGVKDPDHKMGLLLKRFPGEHSFHVTEITQSGQLRRSSDSETPLDTKIGCLEIQLLMEAGLLVEEYY